jgi:ligand-binding sensor protein
VAALGWSLRVAGANGDDERPGTARANGGGGGDGEAPAEPRPLIERVGLGLIALVFAIVFGGLAVGAFVSGEVFLGTMAGIGALMTLWAAAGTTRR